MIIRQETKSDYEAVYEVVKAAFAGAEHADGSEQDLVAALRNSEAFVPELSLVAAEEGRIVGHILFTKVRIGDAAGLALAPLSVHPAYQRQGIGTALIKEGHRIAGRLGYGYAVVLGSETYYPRAGYLPAASFGIAPSFEVPSENYMAYKLREDAAPVHGMVRYPKEFGID